MKCWLEPSSLHGVGISGLFHTQAGWRVLWKVKVVWCALVTVSSKKPVKCHEHLYAIATIQYEARHENPRPYSCLWKSIDDSPEYGEQLLDTKKSMHLLNSLSFTYQTLSKIPLHHQNTKLTYKKVVNALLTDAVEPEILSPFISSTSRATLIMTRALATIHDVWD